MANKILDLLPISVYFKDISGKYIFCNKYMVSLFGYDSPTEIIGRTDSQLPWFKNAASITNLDFTAIQTNKSQASLEKYSISDKGESVFFIVRDAWKDSDEQILGTIGIIIDLSEQGTNAFKGELIKLSVQNNTELALKQIKHDIRSPLSSIISLAEIIKGSSDASEINNLAQIIFDSGIYLNDFIGSRFDFDRKDIKKNTFDVLSVVENVIKIALPIAHIKNIKLDCSVAGKGPFEVCSNKDLLYRILMELVNNAIKYTNQGSVIVTVDSILDIKHNRCVTVEIVDTGLGMEANMLKNLVDQDSEVSYDALEKGGGFGLSFVNSTAGALGIKIMANSILTHGTSVKLMMKSDGQSFIDFNNFNKA